MEERHIYEGKTSTEAIEKGLKDLGLKKSDVEVISVEDEEKRSFFSILEPRVVKVELKIKENIKKEDKKIVTAKEKREMSEEAINKAKQNLGDFLNVFLKQINSDDYNIHIYCYLNVTDFDQFCIEKGKLNYEIMNIIKQNDIKLALETMEIKNT